MTDFPQTFDAAAQPLSANRLSATDKTAIQQLAEQGYEIHVGLTTEYADAIAKMALEPDIREYCPKDSTERFADRTAIERWLGKKRATFLLLKHENDQLRLAGYGWAGEGSSPEVPGGRTTFAVRIGQTDQGKGLATPFSRLIVDGTAAQYGAQNFWLETWGSNGGAVHVYHKLGFETVAEKPAERPTAAGGSVPDVRVYMNLPNELLPDAS